MIPVNAVHFVALSDIVSEWLGGVFTQVVSALKRTLSNEPPPSFVDCSVTSSGITRLSKVQGLARFFVTKRSECESASNQP